MFESMQKHALKYATHGLAILPIHPKTKTPLIPEWQNYASNDPAQIRKWWTKWPNANIGIHTGKSGLVVLDVDPRNGGNESLANLITIHGGEFLSKAEVITGGGGKHYYYAVNENETRQLPSSLGNGLDLLCGKKYVIAPPSIHPSGNVYAWLVNPFDCEEGLDDDEL